MAPSVWNPIRWYELDVFKCDRTIAVLCGNLGLPDFLDGPQNKIFVPLEQELDRRSSILIIQTN